MLVNSFSLTINVLNYKILFKNIYWLVYGNMHLSIHPTKTVSVCSCTLFTPLHSLCTDGSPITNRDYWGLYIGMRKHCKTTQGEASICHSFIQVIPSRHPHLYLYGFFSSFPSVCRAWKETLILQQTQLWIVSLCEICCPFVCCWQA